MTPETLAHSCAAHIHDGFVDYQDRFQQITMRAPLRFMNREWKQLQADTTDRINLYSTAVDLTEKAVRNLLQGRIAEARVWTAAKAAYAGLIDRRTDNELAETFFNSITRRIFDTVGVNRQIEFVHDEREPRHTQPAPELFTSYPLNEPLEAVFRAIFVDGNGLAFDRLALEEVMPAITKRLSDRLGDMDGNGRSSRIDMLRHVFYRGQGAYLIGRIVVDGGRIIPLVAALLHASRGVAVDALLLDADTVSVVFSFTRSAFHVPVERPGELVGFLRSILPAKPEAELYSAIGCYKHGKTVLYRDVCRHTAECTEEWFRLAPGKPGMVMEVFEMAGHDMVVKLIRDRFDTPKRTTREKVMAQYDFVFKHYRVGRLIEAHAFEHLSFDRCWFSDDLLAHLTAEAGNTVHLTGDRVVIDHAYLERRVTPLDIYLQTQNMEKTDAAVVDFGYAIKDLAVANIFPGDMLLKNFGVTRRGRVVFYDYDEIVPLTDCRFREIPQPRTYMEEMADEPWYTVEENDVFPEEFSRFLGLPPRHRDLFLSHHADLLTPEYWTAIQQEIGGGNIRHIRPYDSRYRLNGAQSSPSALH